MRKDLDCINCFIPELKRHNVSHYIYYLATDNIHIVLENDNTVLIKGLKKVVNVKFSETRSANVLWWVEIKKSHFSNTGKILLKQEFSDRLQISMNIKIFYYAALIHYYLLRAFRTLLHLIFPLNHNVRFLPCQHRGVGIMQYVYALSLCASF